MTLGKCLKKTTLSVHRLIYSGLDYFKNLLQLMCAISTRRVVYTKTKRNQMRINECSVVYCNETPLPPPQPPPYCYARKSTTAKRGPKWVVVLLIFDTCYNYLHRNNTYTNDGFHTRKQNILIVLQKDTPHQCRM